MTFITEFTGAIGDFLDAFWPMVVSSIDSAIAIFWDGTTGLTVLGYLAVFGLAVGLVYLGMGFVQRLIRK